MSDVDSLLPPNSTATERSLEQATARTAAVPVQIALLWNPDACPEHLLPYLAWALSVDDWDSRWPLENKRAVLRAAVPLHRVKGTRASVERALAAIGFNIDLSEWFEYGGAVHTFRLDAYGDDVFDAGFQVYASLYATISRVIQNTKPARSHFELRIGERFSGNAYLRSGVRATHVHRLDLEPSARVQSTNATTHLRSGMRAYVKDARMVMPAPCITKTSACIYSRSALRARMTSRIIHDFKVKEGAAYAI